MLLLGFDEGGIDDFDEVAFVGFESREEDMFEEEVPELGVTLLDEVIPKFGITLFDEKVPELGVELLDKKTPKLKVGGICLLYTSNFKFGFAFSLSTSETR
jgi:hypothetical protein